VRRRLRDRPQCRPRYQERPRCPRVHRTTSVGHSRGLGRTRPRPAGHVLLAELRR
jgi:hypothetical protein